ncbi:hypothetical protein A3L25_007655 [Pseudomonas putida]|uniref:Imidazoleglycerol-phosphate synthase n=1 Tax=Pseudomonas putida TaxID=303 RepID=A0AAP9MXX7_PSEPU|nr:hypothetical protein [Pseudomonas putida]QJQ09301.1 hypothetical protein A3L25_007655 [Pseudomonas putida]
MNSKIPALTQASSPQSLDEFLEEMEKGPQTFKWDALLVFDRFAANKLLTQEYIDRIGIEDEFFPTLPDDTVKVGNGIEHVLIGLELDKPLLSFENANILDPLGKLQMRLVGGKHLEVMERYLEGEPVRVVNALKVYNAATFGLLDMNIRLLQAQGSVEGNGKVLLDVDKAFDHMFSGGGTDLEKQQLGIYFKQVFATWREKNVNFTQFPLSEIVVSEGSLFNPGQFRLGTHTAQGGDVLGSENYGNGAVVVFVAMKDSKAGDMPSSNGALLYMLPDAANLYTSNLVLSQKFITEVIRSGLNKFEWIKGKFDVAPLPGERYKLVANASVTTHVPFQYSDLGSGGTVRPWRWKLSVDGVNPQLFTMGDELVFEGRSLKARWHSTSNVGGVVRWTQTGNNDAGHTRTLGIHATASIDASYTFTLSDAGLLKFKLADDFKVTVDISIEDNWGDGDAADDAKANSRALIGELESTLKVAFRKNAEEIMDIEFEVDALRLNNLLFRGENVVDPRDVSMPTDLTLLGNLAPKRTSLVISPSEPIVASGQVIEFTAESELGGVTWKVENLPGEEGETGEFSDSSNGRYTAPSDLALRAEGHRRLIVTATRGDLVSRVLVSVVPSQVTVNPWVAVVNVGMSHSLSAATPHPGGLTWDTPKLGAIAPDDDLLNPGGYKYTAPVKLPEREADDPLYHISLRLDSVTVHPAAGGPAATIDMLVVGSKNANYWLEPKGLPDGRVELPFYKTHREDGKIAVPEPVEWTVLRGSGIVDQATRVYTPAPNNSEQFVIIAAFYNDGESTDTVDYVVLPMPLVPVQRYAEILNPAIKEVCDGE